MNRTHGVTAAILRDIDRFGRQPAIQLRLGNGRPPIREQRFDLLLHAIDRGAKRFLGFGISLAKGLELLGQRTVFSKKEGLGIFQGCRISSLRKRQFRFFNETREFGHRQ
jgi:hypothetical protein